MTFWQKISGYKTYIILIVGLAYAATQWWQGAITQQQFVAAVIAALGGMALRHGVAGGSGGAGTVAKVLIVGACVALATGCANQAAVVHPAIIAADTITITAGVLYRNKSINQPTAHKIGVDLDGANAVFTPLCTNLSAGTIASTTDIQAVTTLLNVLEVDITGNSPQALALKAKAHAMRMRIAAKASISPTEVEQIINILMEAAQIAIDVVPQVWNEIEIIANGDTVTPADCQTALAKFQADLAAYHALVDPPATALVELK